MGTTLYSQALGTLTNMMMKPSRIFLVEDDVTTIKILEVYLSNWGYRIAGSARTKDKALEAIAQTPPDLAILDINLGKGMERDGILLALELRSRYQFPIIFLTGQPELQVMEQAKATRPDAYLDKPISEASLSFAIDNALQQASDRLIQPQPLPDAKLKIPQGEDPSLLLAESLFVKKGHAYHKLPIEQIQWIQADRNYLNIHATTGIHLVSTNLANFARQFDHVSLLRVSRSHIINVHHIERFEENHTVIVAGEVIPIGKTYREVVQQRFQFLKTTR